MPVYVDDMGLPAAVQNGGHVVRGKWSHLLADSEEELLAFAKQLGLRPEWIQHQGEPGAHFDVTGGKRLVAIKLGAKPISWREAGEMVAARRAETPQDRIRVQREKGRESAQKAFALDRQAGLAMRDGQHSLALTFLAEAHRLYPANPMWQEHADRVRAATPQPEPEPLASVQLDGPQVPASRELTCVPHGGATRCGQPARLYMNGPRCKEHAADHPLPFVEREQGPARPPDVPYQAYPREPSPEPVYPDLSHKPGQKAQPGHMCVRDGQPMQIEKEA